MLAEPRDHVEREVGTLELGVGIEHDGNLDRVGDRAEIAFDCCVRQREIGFKDGEDTVGSQALTSLRLCDRIGGRR